MNQNNYDLYRPLMHCKDGDIVSISVESGNKKGIPAGVYSGIFRGDIMNMRIECADEPRLNGAYTYWYGQKWGDNYIHATPQEAGEEE